jgi:hypothetical protein
MLSLPQGVQYVPYVVIVLIASALSNVSSRRVPLGEEPSRGCPGELINRFLIQLKLTKIIRVLIRD